MYVPQNLEFLMAVWKNDSAGRSVCLKIIRRPWISGSRLSAVTNSTKGRAKQIQSEPPSIWIPDGRERSPILN